ncbi:integrase [Escherichia coli]|nr:integrase [Escherichia coli]
MNSLRVLIASSGAQVIVGNIAVTNGAIVIHTQRLKSDPGGNLLS